MSAQTKRVGTEGHDGRARSVEREIEIDAPVTAVWKALTDAEELTRWFPLEAHTVPGAGGLISMSWRDVYGGDSPIEVWEPERRLRLAFPVDGPAAVVTDYYLEGRGGKTALRVVTSGFGEGDAWDDFFDGVRLGWAFELLGLRHYLEHHRGRDRVVAWARVPYTGRRDDVWARLTGPGGFFGPNGLPRLSEGARYAAQTRTGHDLAGTVGIFSPPQQLACTADGFNDALLRLELQGNDRDGTVELFMSTYGVPEGEVRSLEAAWQRAMEGLLAP